MNKKHRNYGIDLIKIIACLLVVTLHCLAPTDPVVKNSIFNTSLYYAGTLAIPIFFMASSYFVLNKGAISYKYSFIRIRNILFVVISWLLLFSIVKFIFKHQFNFIDQLKGSAFTGIPNTNFYHFWFFWALMIMLLIAPLLWELIQHHFTAYLWLTIIMTAICLLIDLSIHLGYSKLVQNTPQVFRLNTWIEYYLLGGLVGNQHFKKILNYIEQRFALFVTLDIILYIILIIYSLWNRNIIHWVYAEANYNNILVLIISVLSLCLFSASSPTGQNVIEFIIPATMGIYIIHPFLIGKVSKIELFYNYPSLMIIIISIICLISVEIALRIPYINKLFRL